jgi:hypothetical protein
MGTCFFTIDSINPHPYYRLYLSNGPYTIAYLKRQGQEHFALIENGRQGFSISGGTLLALPSTRQELTELLSVRGVQDDGWQEVQWSSDAPLLRRSDEYLRQIKQSLQEGKYSRYYEVSLCGWSREPWYFYDLEILPDRIRLKLENEQGDATTDCIWLEDKAALHKFLHCYASSESRVPFPLYRDRYERTKKER